jgi:hypothetical protein
MLSVREQCFEVSLRDHQMGRIERHISAGQISARKIHPPPRGDQLSFNFILELQLYKV